MRFTFTGDMHLYNQLMALKKAQEENMNKSTSFTDVVEQAVFLLYQVNVLLDDGYKLILVDPEGKEHIIRKKTHDPRKDEGSDREDFEG